MGVNDTTEKEDKKQDDDEQTSDDDETESEQDDKIPDEAKKKAAKYKKRLADAKKLIGEVKEMRKTAGKNSEDKVKEKLDELKEELQLPGDWNSIQSVDVDKLIKDIENEINLASTGLALKPIDKFESLIAAVSGGMIRYGLLYPTKDWKNPELKKGQFPVLQYPSSVENLLPQLSSQSEFYKSTKMNASNTFVQKVESSGLSAATSVSANYLFVSGSVSVSSSNETSEQSDKTRKKTSTHASVIKYKCYPIKAFRLPRDEMKLTAEAASDIKQVTNIYDAKKILNKYGSHIPAGVHHLGGIFCDVIDIKSEEEEEEECLTTAASNHFGSEASVGGQGASFGCAVSGSLSISSSKGQTDAQHSKQTNATYKRTVKCFGPDSTNMTIFSNVLESNNATWRIIDRGDLSVVVPLWELLRNISEEYSSHAYLIEEAWKNYHNISDDNMKLIDSLRSLVAAKLGCNWISDSINIINDITSEIDNVQEKIGDECNVTAEVMKIKNFVEFLKNVIKNEQLVVAKKMIRNMLRPEVYGKIKGLVTLDREIDDFIVKSKEVKEDAEIKTHESVPLSDLPSKLFSLYNQLTEYRIDNETCKSKTALLVANAKVGNTEKELYEVVIEKAKTFGYQPDRLSFTNTFAPENLKDMADCLHKIIKTKFMPDERVRFEFETKEKDLGWVKGNPDKIEAVGKIEKVEGFYAFIQWLKLENLSSSSRSSGFTLVKNKISQRQYSRLFGDKKDPEMVTGLKYMMPFWELKPVYESSEVQRMKNSYEILAWKSQKLNKNEKMLSFRDLCVDRPPMPQDEITIERIIDSLKHRIDVFRKYTGSAKNSNDDDWGDDDDGNDDGDDWAETNNQNDVTEPLLTLIELLGKCNLSGRQEVFRKLCDQRYSVPLIYYKRNTNDLINLVNSLRFIDVKLGNRTLELMQDVSLPRVVFVSQRSENLSQSSHMAKEVFRCNMGSRECSKDFGIMAELAIGFLGNKVLSSDPDPWIVLHVRGDYLPLKDFIERFADLIIFEFGADDNFNEPISQKSSVDKKRILKWKITNEKLESNPKKMTISGSFHDVASKMSEAITKIAKKDNLQRNNERQAITDINVGNIQRIDEIDGIDTFVEKIGKIDFSTVRNLLDMQKSYANECEYRLEMQRIRGDPTQMTSKQMKVEGEIEKRREKATRQIQMPILDEFVSVLQIKDEDLRMVALNLFEKIINEECGKVLINEKKRVNDAWDYYISLKDQPNNKIALDKYYNAKLTYANKSLGFENIWRELSHIYAARPSKFNFLPNLAAQHLIDGFVFEILDGDAGIMNAEWMKAVLFSLNKKLKEQLGRDARVFVLSIMGTQSTGKSTLLNTMFGCRLKVSAGQCTRGINLQLIKTENRTGHVDFILIMDTEGIRSPEFFGTDGAIWRDNRLATFSILPADATIITTVNEEDSAIKEVLPIVMLAFKGSNIAEEISGRLRSMLFFVYSRVDTSKQALEKFDSNRRKLQLELQEAVVKIEDFKIAGERGLDMEDGTRSDGKKPEDSSLNRFLTNFRLEDDEEKSDVKYLGLLNKGEKPPDDTPNYDFGEKVANLREYIFNRLFENNFQGQTLNEWSGYLDLVCQCIDATDFELNFKTAVEFQAFNQLKSSIDNSKQKVSKKYSKEYKIYEEEIFNVQPGGTCDLDILKSKLRVAAQDALLQEEKSVRELLNKDVYKRFKTDEMSNWDAFVKEIKKTYENLLKDCYEAKFVYADIVSQYEQKILKNLKEEFGLNPNSLKDPQRRKIVFDKVFQQQLKEAKRNHPPLDVNEHITSEYASLKHINIDHTITDYASKVWSKLKTWFGSEEEANIFRSICEEVTAKAEAKLDVVTNYDGSIVQEIIDYTHKIICDKKIDSKKKQALLHAKIKQLLQTRFKVIQDKWDEGHNIAKKLEKEKNTLKDKFDKICQGFIGTRAVADDIVRGIKSAIKDGFTEYLAEETKGKVEIKPWISKSEVMQAHIDLNLLSLSKQGRTKELLTAVANGSAYYEKILSKLLLAEVDSESCWKTLKNKICKDIPQAAVVASTLESGRFAKFRSEITERLKSSLKKHLSSTTWTDLFELKDELTKDNFIEIGEIIRKAFETSLSKPQIDDKKLVQNITDLLKLEGLSDSQPRCSVSCPRCRMTCRKPASHVKEEGKAEAKHDCKHQPEGLAGVYWSSGSQAQELANDSCDEAVKYNHNMHIDGKSVPYANFEEVYDTWELPKFIQVAKVRKYIFRKYQKQLAEKHGKKECSSITGHYDLGTLETELNAKINE